MDIFHNLGVNDQLAIHHPGLGAGGKEGAGQFASGSDHVVVAGAAGFNLGSDLDKFIEIV
jgi:hypothetical protein